MSATKIILRISGGVLQGVTADGSIEVILLDEDNMKEGDYYQYDDCQHSAEELEGDAFLREEALIRQTWNEKVARQVAASNWVKNDS